MIFPIIQEIKADSSKLAKIAILTKNKDNELLQKALVACYNPYTQYYLRKIPAYTPKAQRGYSLDNAIDDLSLLSEREVTGHAAVDHVRTAAEAASRHRRTGCGDGREQVPRRPPIPPRRVAELHRGVR